jgi:glycosyltransferase involved in cell wall biosynthesis
MSRLPIICMTPVKNEAWVLDRFLRCAALWADHIIIADQGSTDGSRDIARNHSKTILIDNPSPVYDQGAARALLLDAARRIPGPRMLVALDADEILTATFLHSPDWRQAGDAPPGTVFTMSWPLILPNFGGQFRFEDSHAVPFAMVDDGSSTLDSRPIHEARLPLTANSPRREIVDVAVMHLQTHHQPRLASKQRWYQCWELMNSGMPPGKIFRLYHRLLIPDPQGMASVPPDWLDGYRDRGIEANSPYPEDERFWWDREVLALMERSGAAGFGPLAIWDYDWVGFARELELPQPERFADPRSARWRWYHRWLVRTQPRRRDRSVVLAHSAIRRLLAV